MVFFFFFKQKTAYEMRISDWSSDVCSSDLDGALKLYADHGVSVVKTGYVRPSGTIVDGDGGPQWFAGQYAVRHHLDVVKRAAQYHIAIDTHAPVKDTGLRRTCPNLVSREGAPIGRASGRERVGRYV